MLTWKVDKRITDDLRHVLVVFWLGGAPKGPQGPKWFLMYNLVCYEKAM